MDRERYARNYIESIRELDEEIMKEAAARQNQLTKPPGSLGKLEALSVHVAGIENLNPPRIERKFIFTMAGDHGVTSSKVSPYPQEVTAQMVLNFLTGGAAINVLAKHVGAELVVVDMGVATDLPNSPGIVKRKVSYGTKNFLEGPAMSREQAWECVESGIKLVEEKIPPGHHVVGIGDMGIGNTTASSAITSVVTGTSPNNVTGPGTGLDKKGVSHKTAVIEQALSRNQPDKNDAIDILSKVGGFEIGGLAGVIIGAAGRRMPVVLDGFITTAAALIAITLAPAVKPFLIASHESAEPGHRIALDYLGLDPLLSLHMRLGEGTGAALGMSLVEASTKILSDMKTFEEAGVSSEETSS